MAQLVDVSRLPDRFRRPVGPTDAAVVALADLQHGVVGIGQLFELGLTPDMVRSRVERGLLTRVHRGVFAVGRRRLDDRGRMMGATLAGGPRALTGYLFATGLWGLRPVPRSRPEIVVAGHAVRSTSELKVHRMRNVHSEDRASRDGIPVTSIELTCLHACAQLSWRSAERTVVKAARLEEFDELRAIALCDRSKGRRGVRLFRSIIARNLTPEQAALSELELRFIEICRKQNLPMPQINRHVEEFMVDAIWHESRAIVELDGYRFHRLPRDLRRDNKRNRELVLAGYRVIRFGWSDLSSAARVATEVRCLLNLGSATTSA